jgi:hypothetical protein
VCIKLIFKLGRQKELIASYDSGRQCCARSLKRSTFAAFSEREEVPKGLRSGNMYIFARCRELSVLAGAHSCSMVEKISPRAACLHVCAKLCATLILRG